jgi:DNA invertase Pin-like site-specific DNA recombinase
MKAAIYARVSREEQHVETQLVALRDYCLARRWEIINEYVDEGISGSEGNRTQLKLLMQHAGNRWFKVVLVWKFDRMFRSLPHMLESLDRFRVLGIDFVSVTEPCDTSTAMGQMIYKFLAIIAEFEQSLIKERTRAGIARARAEGKRIGRPCVQIDIEEALKLYDGGKGLSFGKIAQKLGCSKTSAYAVIKQAVLKASETVSECSKPVSGQVSGGA